MKNFLLWGLALLCAGMIVGCGPGEDGHQGHDHAEEGVHDGHDGHHDHADETAGARFEEGRGIFFLDETRQAIGLTLGEVGERILHPVVSVEAQVYRSAAEVPRPGAEQSGFAYASAFLPPDIAATVRVGDPGDLRARGIAYSATVWKVESASREAVNSEEVLLQIPDKEDNLHVGDFLTGALAPQGDGGAVVAMPRSGVLETASGKFAYVEKGGAFLRVPVVTGRASAEFIEITEGLAPGDRVVTHPVETLHLIELRATKGGGHAH